MNSIEECDHEHWFPLGTRVKRTGFAEKTAPCVFWACEHCPAWTMTTLEMNEYVEASDEEDELDECVR